MTRFSLTLLLLPLCLPVGAVLLQTHDGLRLDFTQDGAVNAVWLGQQRLRGEAVSGFLVEDVKTGSKRIPMRGTVRVGGKSEARIAVAASELNLELEAKLTAANSVITAEGVLRNTGQGDRAVCLYFALPVDAIGWTWWDHLRQNRTIKPGTVYEQSSYVLTGKHQRMARYCFSAITNDRFGLSIGIPMNRPAPYRLEYDADQRQFYIACDFGIVSDTLKFPNAAPFSFLLYRIDEPQWGFRSAVRKYYDLHPRFFVKRATREGIWKNFGRISAIPLWQDFCFGFFEAPASDDEIAWAQSNGIATFHYDEPWDWWMGMSRNLEKSYDNIVAEMNRQAKADPKSKAAAAVVSALHNKEGKVICNPADVPWCYGAWFALNCDPEVSPATEDGVNAATFSRNSYLGRLAGGGLKKLLRGWSPAGSAYEVGKLGRGAGQCVRVTCPTAIGVQGLVQSVTLNQVQPRPLVIEAYSRAKNVPPQKSANYAVWLELDYADHKKRPTAVACFDPSVRDWQRVKLQVLPEAPVTSARIRLMFAFREGVVWFDDISLREGEGRQNLLANGGFEESGEAIRAAGAYFDGSPEYAGDQPNYRREHWQYADIPLGFDANRNSVQLSLFSNHEYFEWMCDQLHARGLLTMSNGPMRSSFGFYNYLVDVPGSEVWWSGAKGKLSPESDAVLSFRRVFCYQKPYLMLMCQTQNFAHEMVHAYLAKSLAFGMFPAMNGGVIRENDRWKEFEFYKDGDCERDRDLYRRYLPVCQEIARAGWEPITHASVTPSTQALILERFGYGERGNLFLTCYNEASARAVTNLTVDATALKLPKQCLAVEVLSRRLLSVARAGASAKVVTFPLDSLEVACFHIGEPGQLRAAALARTLWDLSTVERDLPRAAEALGRERTARWRDELSKLSAALKQMSNVGRDPAGQTLLPLASARDVLSDMAKAAAGLPEPQHLAGSVATLQADLSLLGSLATGLVIKTEATQSGTGEVLDLRLTVANLSSQPVRLERIEPVPPADLQVLQPAELRPVTVQPGKEAEATITLRSPAITRVGTLLSLPVGLVVDLSGRQVKQTAVTEAKLQPKVALRAEVTSTEPPTVRLTARNLSSERQTVYLRICWPAGWPKTNTVEARLSANESRGFEVTPLPPAGMAARNYDVRAEISYEADADPVDSVAFVLPYFPAAKPMGTNVALVTAGATVKVDSSCGDYNAKPLNDGVRQPDGANWLSEQWASAETTDPHWVEITLHAPRRVHQAVLYWCLDHGSFYTSRAFEVQVWQAAEQALGAGQWVTVASRKNNPEGQSYTLISFDPVVTDRVRLWQPPTSGSTERPNLLWLNEVEVYAVNGVSS